MYRLLALDIDGTTLNSQHKISPRVISAISQAKAAGVEVVLASGRPVEGIIMHLETLGLNRNGQFVVSYNGALVQQIGSDLVLGNLQVHGRDAKKIAAQAKVLGVHVHAFSLKRGLITPEVSRYTEHEAFMNDIPWTTIDFNELDDDEPLVKVMMIDEPELLSPAVTNLPKEYYQQYSILRSAPFFLEFMHPDAHKGNGVAALAEHLNIAREEVICVGDAGNDHHMIRWAGLGIAMGNADSETKALADEITGTNDEDGVAQVIEKYILNV